MAEYIGRLSDYGESLTRKNEITADDVALLRDFIFGNDYGVIKTNSPNDHALECEITGESEITVHSGMMYAYGYVGYFPNDTVFTFLPPSVTQYHIIYAELDRSVIPNTAKLKTKNNQGSPNITENTLRQDILSVIKTGVFQLPLVIATISALGIEEIKDLREIREKIYKVVNSQYAKAVIGNIRGNATGTTSAVIDKRIATTACVDTLVKAEINR